MNQLEQPPAADCDRATIQRNAVVSGALASRGAADRVVGAISFAATRRKPGWSADRVTHLQPVGEILADTLTHRDVERALRLALEENARLRERLEAENVYLHAELDEAHDFREIVGRSPTLRATLEKVRQVADTNAPVLLLGETGTGKELLARTLHASGPRRDRSFITVNCAALPAGSLKASSSATRRVPSPARRTPSPGVSSSPTPGHFSSTRSATSTPPFR